MTARQVIVIGAGIGGLSAAAILSARGLAVTVLETAAAPGGKMRQVESGGQLIDAGPTVFTMRSVIEAIFADAGGDLSGALRLQALPILARHSWLNDQGAAAAQLDLLADRNASAAAMDVFAGKGEGKRYLAFCDRARDIHDTLLHSFMTVERPSQAGLVLKAGIGPMLRIQPFSAMWAALARSFSDPRLQQLFARYATYCGSSPFLAPATLMLIAHVEQEGVWNVDGGMHALAQVFAQRITMNGGTIRYGCKVRHILTAQGRASGVLLDDGEILPADAIISNADTNAIAAGLFGDAARKAVTATRQSERALSAVTWAVTARTSGFPLLRHNVYFSRNYRAEFDALASGKMPPEPTIYVCAQDRDDGTEHPAHASERLLILINAPPSGDRTAMSEQEIDQCQRMTFAWLARHGLTIAPSAPPVVTTPDRFEALFPATGGSLYGRATHGPMASFTRPTSRTALKGLYLAGGSVHPGAGVPMAALSGRIAASSLLQDCGLTPLSPLAAMRGGMSMQ